MPHNTETVNTALWRVRLWGDLQVVPAHSDEGSAENFRHFRTHKTALLLVRLLLQPHRSQSRDELADWLWPDLPADRGRANLSQTLLHLRQQFGASSFVADHRTVALRGGVFASDVAHFEHLFREARTPAARNLSPSEQAARWEAVLEVASHGDLLPGFYDDWIEQERGRLTTLREQAAQCLQQARARINLTLPPAPLEAGLPTTVGFPLTLTRFFGRDTEREHLAGLLTAVPPVRLVSLRGMGGIGKTRLAVEVAPGLVHDREESPFGFAAFVPLADVRDPAHIIGALQQTLGLDAAKDSPEASREAVCRFLRETARHTGRRVLLILDNMEQFGDGSAPVVTRLLTDVPALTVLVTSRQPVGVAGEQEVPVGPLTGDAVRLFVDRARLVRPAFALNDPNNHHETTVRELCTLLEGVPLALELAAAWVRSLTPAQIADRLNHRFDLLTRRGASRDTTPKRHQSLRATLTGSYDLLSPSLQVFFVALAVFRGGWTAEAAASVADLREASEPLLLLTERSLILAEADEATGAVRYRMLESLREFAEEQGATHNTASFEDARLRHARYFEALSQQGDAAIQAGAGTRPVLVQCAPERENIRAALVYTLQSPPCPDSAERITLGVRLVRQTQWLWSLNEGDPYLQWAADAIRHLPDKTGLPHRAGLLALQGTSALLRGDYLAARQKLEDSRALWEWLNEPREKFTVKNRLASLASKTGDEVGAIAAWTECLAFAQATHDEPREAAILNNLANLGSHIVDLAARRAWIERAVALDRRHSPQSHLLACSLNSMAEITLEQDNRETARACLEEAHALAVADGSVGMIGVTKASLAGFFLTTGDHLDQADTLLVEAQSLFEERGEPPRVREMIHLRFQVALKRGDGDAALCHARACSRIDQSDPLRDTDEARAEMANLLRNAGFPAHAEQLLRSPL